MTKLSEFMESQGKRAEPKKGLEMDMDMQCQICFEYVDGAEYFHIEKLLKWTCSQGHVSYVEDFRL